MITRRAGGAGAVGTAVGPWGDAAAGDGAVEGAGVETEGAAGGVAEASGAAGAGEAAAGAVVAVGAGLGAVATTGAAVTGR